MRQRILNYEDTRRRCKDAVMLRAVTTTSLLALDINIRMLLRIWSVRSSGKRSMNWKKILETASTNQCMRPGLPASPVRRAAMNPLTTLS